MPAAAFSQGAKSLYEATGNRVYQILIIDNESQEKSSIGSGFLSGQEPLLVTNFHVVASAIHEPTKFHIQAKSQAGEIVDLKILDFDVINDLALLQFVDADSVSAPLRIGEVPPTQGELIYSLGNPFDLGQTIIPGTFNGLLEHSFYQKLHFSGSLNPGMSGGPALNGAGEVVGINVASAGNQVSFLVPTEFLVALVAKYRDRGTALSEEVYAQEIADQLYADQAFKFELLLSRDWGTQTLGDVRVGADIDDYFKCWGSTHDADEVYLETRKSCSSQDNIFISRDLTTGAIDLTHVWLTSEHLNTYRFHKLFGNRFSSMHSRSWASEDDVTEYQCNQDFVQQMRLKPHVWRAVFCTRQYKNYPRLFDVLYQGLLLGDSTSGVASTLSLSGVSKENALAFARKFMELQSWDS